MDGEANAVFVVRVGGNSVVSLRHQGHGKLLARGHGEVRGELGTNVCYQ